MTPREALSRYEREANGHDFARVEPLLADDAVFWFNDGSFRGKEEIRESFEETWARIQKEHYLIEDVEWLVEDDDAAVCIYRFRWHGIVRGEQSEGGGRGTSVFRRIGGDWKVVHEHLSTPSSS